MARSLIPDPLERRHLLAGALDATRGTEIAEAYLAAERPVEAVAFFEKAENEAGLERLREQAIAEGDVFLLREASTASRLAIDSATWAKLAAAAEASGKESYAEEAKRQASRLADRES
jgi:uncharacterized phosphosugar-binding protein